jgi:biotin carboxylase
VPELMIFVESNTTGTGRLFAERARDLGLVPYLLSADAGRYPYVTDLAIGHQRCRTDAPAAVRAGCRALARTHRVAGVTSSSEYFVATAAAAARDLGLPGEDPRLLAAARDKGFQRRRFAARGLDSPAFHLAASTDQAVRAAERLGPPVVVKPVSRSGSIGVRRCNSIREVAAHATDLLAATVDERGNRLPAAVLVEACLTGPEVSVELLDGEVCAVVAKHLDQTRGFLEIGHDVPADLDARIRATVGAAAQAALAALGLSWGAAHVELRLVDGRAYIVEVNPRLAGGMIPQAIQAATGRDLVAELVARTAGRSAPRPPARRGYASVRFLVPAADGEVAAVPDRSKALALPGVVEAALTARPGQRIVRQGSFLDRLGYVIATGQSRRQASARAERAVAALPVAVVAPEPTPSRVEKVRPW